MLSGKAFQILITRLEKKYCHEQNTHANRSEFFPENTIDVCSENPVDNHSIKAIKWLKYISLTQNINITHACNGGEQAFE